MEFLIKHFNDLNTNELYEIVKSRFEVFVMEQKIVDEHDFDDKDKLENKKLLDEINERNRYLSKIVVTGIKGIDDELRKIKNI